MSVRDIAEGLSYFMFLRYERHRVLARLPRCVWLGQKCFSRKLPVITVADHYYWPYLSKSCSRVPDSLSNLERWSCSSSSYGRSTGEVVKLNASRTGPIINSFRWFIPSYPIWLVAIFFFSNFYPNDSEILFGFPNFSYLRRWNVRHWFIATRWLTFAVMARSFRVDRKFLIVSRDFSVKVDLVLGFS